MKKLTLLIFVALSFNTFAADKSAPISTDKQQTLDALIEKLGLTGLSKKKKDLVFATFSHTLNNDWYAEIQSIDSAATGKASRSKTKILDLNVVDEHQLHIISYIYFGDKKELHVAQREIVSGTATAIMGEFDKYKANDRFAIKAQNNNFVYLQNKGYSEYLILQSKNPSGVHTHISYSVVDL